MELSPAHFKFGYHVPQQEPVPIATSPHQVQYRPIVEFHKKRGSWWARPPRKFEVYRGGVLKGSVLHLDNCGWMANSGEVNGGRGLGVERTRARAAWLVLNQVWTDSVHIPGKNDAYYEVFHGPQAEQIARVTPYGKWDDRRWRITLEEPGFSRLGDHKTLHDAVVTAYGAWLEIQA